MASATGSSTDGDPFFQAKDEFLASISSKDRSLYSPCASTEALIESISKLDALGRRHAQLQTWIHNIGRLAECLKPYFSTVDVLVPSNPEYAAIVWGAFRLLFQLAANFNTFFDKLTALLAYLIDSFPQYEMVLELIGIMNDGSSSDVMRKPHFQDSDEGKILRKIIVAVYRDILQIVRTALLVFTKPDGRLEGTAVVIGQLMWRPFGARFGDLIQQMAEHRKALFEAILLFQSNDYFRERVKDASERLTMTVERENDETERQLVSRVRHLMAEEREQDSKARRDVEVALELLREQMKSLEGDRIQRAWSKIRTWVAAPDYLAPYERALRAREDGTATWVFENPLYTKLFEAKPEPPKRSRFGSRALWIYGHPGCGKTVLAASIASRLSAQSAAPGASDPDVYYYFFDFDSVVGRSPIAAYRSLVAQMLWKRQADRSLLDQCTFIMDFGSQGDAVSGEGALIDLLKFGLRQDSIIIMDGLDECIEDEAVVKSLFQLSSHVPSLRLLFLSRVNVTALSHSIGDEMRLQISPDHLATDIRDFYDRQLEELFDRGLLPESSRSDATQMTEWLMSGANGMFLWARLMIKYLKSGFLTPHYRAEVIMKVNFLEGLERMYERIIELILSAGGTSGTIASRSLALILHTILPLTSRQLRQALVADGVVPSSVSADDIKTFEDAVINACAGLVESYTAADLAESETSTTYLRLVHLTADEMLKHTLSDFPNAALKRTLGNARIRDLVPDPINANLYLASCCLQQLLNHTPAQPLSGKLNQGLSETQLGSRLPFTEHSAVLWITYLNLAAKTIRSNNAYEPVQSALFEDPLKAAIDLMWAFVGQPAALSVWLESFYTAAHHRSAIGYQHPPTELFVDWADALQILGGASNLKLAATLRDLGRDLDEAVKVWGGRLEEAPQIVWDEMTGFHSSPFFFQSGSTQVSSQEPTPPTLSGLSSQPVAVASRTADNGEVKGVLSVWIPTELRDERYTYSIMGSTVQDDARISSGWVAVYELWNLVGRTTKIVRVECPLEPEQVLHHAQRYINQFFPPTIELPLSISPDCFFFTALLTLFGVQTNEDGTTRCLSAALPVEAPRPDRPMIWFRYNTYVNGAGRYVVFQDKTKSHKQSLSVFWYQVVEDGLAVEEVRRVDFRGNLAGVWNMTFHPSLAILAFKAVLQAPEQIYKYAIVIWLFGKATRSMSIEDFDEPDKTIKLMQFSSCGKRLIFQPQSSTSNPRVIPVPSAFLSDPDATLSWKSTTGSSEATRELVHRPKASGSLSFLGYTEPPRTIARAWVMEQDQTPTPISVALDQGNVTLSLGLGPEAQTSKILALPPSYHLETMAPTLILPQAAGDSLRVSTDRAVRISYPVASKSPESSKQAPIAVFERDPGFVSAPRSLMGLMPGSVEQAQSMLEESHGQSNNKDDAEHCRKEA